MNNQNITRKKKKRAWLGYGREKLNVKDVLERLLDLPDESIKVYDINDKEYKIMKKEEERKKKLIEGRKQLQENLAKKPDTTRDPSSKQILNSDGTTSIINPDGTTQETTTQSTQKGESTTQTSSEGTEKNETEPIPSNFNFDSSIDTNDQAIIKGLLSELNIVLRLPELNLFSDKAIKPEGEPDIVTIIETTINEADNSEKQNTEKLVIPPFITINEQ